MINIYHRYFKITGGQLMRLAEDFLAIKEQCYQQCRAIAAEIGAEDEFYIDAENHRFAAFKFKKSPCLKTYRKVEKGWYPKKNNKAGKALHEKISAVQQPSLIEFWQQCGLSKSSIAFSFGNIMYRNTEVFLPAKTQLTVFISIPWYDINPEEIQQYKNDRADGTRCDMNLDHLLWKPTLKMQEVEEWDVDTAINDHNESIKEKGG